MYLQTFHARGPNYAGRTRVIFARQGFLRHVGMAIETVRVVPSYAHRTGKSKYVSGKGSCDSVKCHHSFS
jgi:hypothetical protein